MDGVRQVEADDGPAGAEDRGDAARDGGGPARRAHAVRRSPTTAPRVLAAQLASSLLVVGAGDGGAARLAGSWRCASSACPPQLLASSLGLVLGQRLVRTICRICQVPAEAPAAQTLAAHGIDRDEALTLVVLQGQGLPDLQHDRLPRSPGHLRGDPRERRGALGTRARPPGEGDRGGGGRERHDHDPRARPRARPRRASRPSTSSRGCGSSPDPSRGRPAYRVNDPIWSRRRSTGGLGS